MKVTTSAKLAKKTKNEASKLASQMGFSLNSIINASLKQFVQERRISFSVEPELNSKSKKNLRQALKDLRNNKNLSKSFSNTEKLRESLLK